MLLWSLFKLRFLSTTHPPPVPSLAFQQGKPKLIELNTMVINGNEVVFGWDVRTYVGER